MLGTTESVYIDIVTKMWHPLHSATAQRNFLCGRTGPDWPIQGATGSRETYISQLEASTLKLWNNKQAQSVFHTHIQTHTHTQNILSYKNIWPLLLGLLLNSCHTTQWPWPYSSIKHTHIPHMPAIHNAVPASCHSLHFAMWCHYFKLLLSEIILMLISFSL